MGTITTSNILPFKSHFVTIKGGYNVHYLDEGEGETLVLIHGNPTWCFFYRNLIRELRDEFRVIALDLVGCGLSCRPKGETFRLQDRIKHLESFFEEVGIKECSLIMHDWGGPIGTGLAVRHSDWIKRLVFLNTTLTEVETLPWIIKTAAQLPLGRLLTKYSGSFVKMATGWGVYRKLPREIKQNYQEPYRKISSREAIATFVEDIPLSPQHPSYRELVTIGEGLKKFSNTPVQIVWGLKDPCFHREMLSKVANHFPHAEVVEIPDASHLVLEDAPERSCSVIKEFLLRTAVEIKNQTKIDGKLQNSKQASENGAIKATKVNQILHGEFNSLYDRLQHWADVSPDRAAIVTASENKSSLTFQSTSYQDLLKLTRRYERGLTELGLLAGDRVLFLVPMGPELLALVFAVMGRGGIPVFADPGVGLANLTRCIETTDCSAAILAPKAKLLQFLRRGSFKKMKFVVTASDWRLSKGATLSFLKKYSSAPMARVEPNSVALIACTSGATGVPKGVEFTQTMINEHIRLFVEVLGQKVGDKDVPFLPLFALYDIGLGATAVLPRFDASRPLEIDPAHAVRVLREAQVNSSFGSPTIWHKLSEYMAKSSSELPALRRIFLIGAPVQDATLEMLRKVVSQDCSVFTPYGATEALPVAVVSSDERLNLPQVASLSREQGVLVGRAVPGLELKVVAISDGPLQSVDSLPPLEIGEILVSGAQVSQKYFRNESATRLSKIDVDGKRWHRMGDVGYLDSNGFLYFCGRAVHRVVTRDRTYFSVPAERVANAHPNVRRSALVGLYGGREAALVIEPEPSKWPDSSSAEKLFELELLKLTEIDPATKGISKFFFHRSFPVDGRHNAKIFRGELGEWATKVDRKRHFTADSARVVNWKRR